jgi:SulP family sulfate permease
LPKVTTRLLKYLESLHLAAGEYLIHQGEDSNDLYFVEAGQVTVLLNMPDGKQMRFRTAGAGTLMGEVSFYRGIPRTASVIADEATIVYKLTRSALETMQEHDPKIAAACTSGLQACWLAAWPI